MKTDLSNKYDLRVPRYTSYPTAPHFSESVTGETYAQWLSELNPEQPLSLYSHIPFCDEMCWFCGCYTKIVKRYEPIADYMDVLLDEIDLAAKTLPGRFSASHLHWGGGSPTILKGADWKRIIDRMKLRFDIAVDAEIAVEMDARTASEDYVVAMAEAGVNRASIGVQDFDDQVQQAINRIQPYEMTAEVIGWLRKHGIVNINMDLMYGLPHQTVEKVRDMSERTLGLNPARVALFGYAHVPWMKSHQKLINEDDLPGAEERWEQFETATNILVGAGYVQIGLDHFAHPDDSLAVALDDGTLHRNFQGYTTDKSSVLLGFGASAIGSLPQGFVQNQLPLKAYREAVGAGKFPIGRGIAYSDEDRLRGDIIERLMCDLTADLSEICASHGVNADDFAPEMAKIATYAADDLVTIDGTRITVTETGRPFVRLVAAAFDAYLDEGQTRHSRAV